MIRKEVAFREPLQEGKVPKDYGMGPDGKLYELIPEESDYDDYFEGREQDTETYFLTGREEYWGFETNCKICGTAFMAYGKDSKEIRNYCPGCGRKLI